MDYPVRPAQAAAKGGSRSVIWMADTTSGPHDWPVRIPLPTLSNHSQCDLAQPACGQCIRSSRKCGGYRNQIDLVFRDQSEDVRSKAKGVKRVSKAVVLHEVSKPQTTSASQRGTCSQPTSDQDEIPALCTSIQVSIQSQAVLFFFANYSKEQSLKQKSIHEYLPDLYARESERSAFSSAITAIGLAGLSHRRSEPALLTASGQWYASALHQTNEALLEPLVATRNETLASIVLLGLYEVGSRSSNLVLHR